MQTQRETKVVQYPTSSGRPLAETDCRCDLIIDLIESVKAWYGDCVPIQREALAQLLAQIEKLRQETARLRGK